MSVGLHIMRPTSIVVAGGGSESASIRADGGVDFANATSLSLNGVFTADYDNYMISLRLTSSAGTTIRGRLRLSGTDATAGNYTRQTLNADGTTVNGARATSETGLGVADVYNTQRAGYTAYLYGPNLAQPTAYRMLSVSDYLSGTIFEQCGTHSLSTAYDGWTLYHVSAGPTITGMITVYGWTQ